MRLIDLLNSNKKIAVYPGSFDPLTNGHLDIIHRASKLFDHLIVGVLTNSAKSPIFTKEERVELIRKCTLEYKNVEVKMFDGLLVDFVRENDAVAIIKGLRAVSDYEYELQMAALNKHIDHEIETVFLMADIQNSFLSSSIVKEIASYGGDIRKFLPECIVQTVYDKYTSKK